MSPAALDRQLLGTGRMLAWWRARLKLTGGGAVIVGAVAAFSLLDLSCRCSRPSRFMIWSLLVALVAVTVWRVRRALVHRFSPAGVAALLERAFPDLDNHLINYLQFSHNPEHDPFKDAYVKAGVPEWRKYDRNKMKNRQAHLRSQVALAVAIALLVLPGLFLGRAWGVAVWRTVNPFANTQPASLTRILEVTPGDTTVLQGDSLVLACKVRGHSGHEVWLDVHPNDADKTTYSLGRISLDGVAEFPHRIPRVTTDFRYRFRAGDAPDLGWSEVATRPPPALVGIRVKITPPGYTKRPSRTFNALGEELRIPQGSRAEVEVTSNAKLKAVTLAARDVEPVTMTRLGDATAWKGALTVAGGTKLTLDAEDVYGTTLKEQIDYSFEPDRPPAIEVVSPRARTVLTPGSVPQIEFNVLDDYGLADVTVEQIKVGAARKTEGTPEQTWALKNALTFEQVWRSPAAPPRNSVVGYRIVARDNCPFGRHTARSFSVLFNADSYAGAADKRDNLEQAAFAVLSQVIELQRRNIAKTRMYQKILDQSTAEHWDETSGRQERIRALTRELLTNPIKPLGNLAPTARNLYVNEMADVIVMLAGIPAAGPTLRLVYATKALNMEEKILRQLTLAEVAAAKSQLNRHVSGLAAMLTALIREQARTLKRTREYALSSAPVNATLVDAQDNLAADLTEFIAACRRESSEVAGNDRGFADTMNKMADRCEDGKIRADMMMASERLDENKAEPAIPFEQSALRKLKAVQAMFDGIAMQEQKEEREDMLEALRQAKEKIARIKELHEKMIESMEQVKAQKDKSGKDVDLMEEEFQELAKNTRDSILEVPTDLHIFMDLNVANDLVEDVFSVFEEVEHQETGSEGAKGKVNELAYAKREELLEMMEIAEDRLDDMEMWLGQTADTDKTTVEPFDQEEMPEAGMALGALATEVEDLIGDLINESDEAAEQADDGAVNSALPDWESGWEVMEGDLATFGAKGKSGNDAPDHKEQDGRSNVGRQGMSVGETAAGSGTISEGDKNIEERRTQDPTQSGQVDLEGETDTKAAGGGKLGTGKADDLGMAGGVERMDSNEAGSWEGMAALMAKQADAMYAKASMKNVRSDSLKEAAHHLRQSADAIANGNIAQMKEFRKLAVSSLQRAKAELAAGPAAGFEAEGAPGILYDVVAGGPDLAPPKYRDLVAEYYKTLNDSL